MDAALGPSRRERKKAATRAHIADTALALFLERGYENVTVRDVAAAADVSPTTLLNHFPAKEALVVDLGDEITAELTAAVTERAPGVGVLDALHGYARARVERATAAADPDAARFLALVFGNADLSAYWHRTWMGHEAALTAALREQAGAAPDSPYPAVTSHFVLEAISFAIRSPAPAEALTAAFDILANGSPS
jgi:AcrR family transcriptional regulator